MKERLLDLRARIQCYRSGKFTYGWIVAIDYETVAIEFAKKECSVIGDKHYIEVSVGKELLMFDGVLRDCDAQQGVFSVCGTPRVAKSRENMRLRVSIDASILYQHRQYPSKVVDLSADGLGVLTDAAVKRRETGQIDIYLERGTVKLIGQSLYCHDLSDSRWMFRLGMHVPMLNQLLEPEDGDILKAVKGCGSS